MRKLEIEKMSRTRREITRYANRKFYCPDFRCYVSVKEIARMVHDGEDLKIVEDRTGVDVTFEILLKILCGIVRSHFAAPSKGIPKEPFPRVVLRRLVTKSLDAAPGAKVRP
jgi:hypothetical protein